jgi:hypothetical protein
MPCARRLKHSSAPAQRHVLSNAQIRHAHAKVPAPAPDLSPGQACHSTILCQHPPPLSFLPPPTKASPTDPTTPWIMSLTCVLLVVLCTEPIFLQVVPTQSLQLIAVACASLASKQCEVKTSHLSYLVMMSTPPYLTFLSCVAPCTIPK